MKRFARALAKMVGIVLLGSVALLIPPKNAAGHQDVPDEITALQNAVATLRSQLATVQAGNSTLQNQVTGLQGQLNTLQSNVTSNDTALQSQITNLQNQQTNLSNTVTTIQNQNQIFVGRGSLSGRLNNTLPATVVTSVSVPAGNYLIYAVVGVTNQDTDDQTGECALSTAVNPFHTSIPTPNDSQYRIPGIGTNNINPVAWQAQLPLLDTATFTSDTTITLSCIGFSWTVTPTIVAVNVGNIH
jgi:TolA-binding protein